MTEKENKKGLVKTLVERCKADTPPFFKKLRFVGLTLAAAGGVLVAAPIALPAAIVTVGGYLIVAGSVATAVSQVAVTDDGCESKKKQ
ncbi:MAG: hypothetical protein HYX39_09975 [Bacteroidetes bacterium]|nr:hypothetical protein [Bacteroidota bacterium]